MKQIRIFDQNEIQISKVNHFVFTQPSVKTIMYDSDANNEYDNRGHNNGEHRGEHRGEQNEDNSQCVHQ